MEWRPIESAPMNGNLVLVGSWVGGGWLYMDIARRMPYSQTDFQDQKYKNITTATHWCPIPKMEGEKNG